VVDAAKRIFGIPNFRYHALADGIREILTKAGQGIIRTQAQACRQGHHQIAVFKY
jgi:hypothetical protein